MGGSCVGVAGAMEQDMFLCVPVWVIWVRGVRLGVVGVSTRAQGDVVCSLSEVVGVVGVGGMICCPLEDDGGDEAVREFCCGLDCGRGSVIRGGSQAMNEGQGFSW